MLIVTADSIERIDCFDKKGANLRACYRVLLERAAEAIGIAPSAEEIDEVQQEMWSTLTQE